MNEAEIKAKYIQAHNELEKQYYKHRLITKEEFDLLHGQNWNDMEAELIAEGYRKPSEPVRDAFAEIDKINEKLELPLTKRK